MPAIPAPRRQGDKKLQAILLKEKEGGEGKRERGRKEGRGGEKGKEERRRKEEQREKRKK